MMSDDGDRDKMKTKNNKQWFEDENFWINYAPIMFDDARWNEAPAVAGHVKKIANLSDGDSVLDAGCGLGRISTELALLNLKTTGVDIIESELQAARESAEAEGLSIEYINADLRSFSRKEQYNCVINLYTSFGYCDTQEEDLLILKNMCDCVKKGGTFMLECVSRETAILYWTPGEEFERAGYKVVTHFEVRGAWEGLLSQWTLYPLNADLNDHKTKPIVDHVFTQRLYSAAFLRDKILSFGFSDCQVWGDYDGSPYDQNAKTMLLVAKK